MVDFKVVKESAKIRCEICHQKDEFDAEKNYCSRCESINSITYEAKSEKVISKLWDSKLFRFIVIITSSLLFCVSLEIELWIKTKGKPLFSVQGDICDTRNFEFLIFLFSLVVAFVCAILGTKSKKYPNK